MTIPDGGALPPLPAIPYEPEGRDFETDARMIEWALAACLATVILCAVVLLGAAIAEWRKRK